MAAEKPILFCGEMVRAILAGHKTQTRRVIVPQPSIPKSGWDAIRYFSCVDRWCWSRPHNGGGYDRALETQDYPCIKPKYKVGDVLWVRETWNVFDDSPEGEDFIAIPKTYLNNPIRPGHGCQGERQITWRARYRADGELNHPEYGLANWKPSIHMPKWAARIFLEVTKIRAERVQDIDELDALAEGVECERVVSGKLNGVQGEYAEGAARDGYKGLWDSINKKRGFGWDVNPWVFVYEFKRIERKAGE